MLSDGDLFMIIHSMELKFGKKSCWKHMSTLEAVVMKCKKKSEMLWILATIEDLLLRGEASNSQFSSRSLRGGRTGGGSRGLMDEWLAKRSILDWILADAGTYGLPSDICPCPCSRSSHPMPMFGQSSWGEQSKSNLGCGLHSCKCKQPPCFIAVTAEVLGRR